MVNIKSLSAIALTVLIYIAQYIGSVALEKSIFGFLIGKTTQPLSISDNILISMITAIALIIFVNLIYKLYLFSRDFLKIKKNTTGWWVYAIMVNPRPCELHDSRNFKKIKTAKFECYLNGRTESHAPEVKLGYFHLSHTKDGYTINHGKACELKEGCPNFLISQTNSWKSINLKLNKDETILEFIFKAYNSKDRSKFINQDTHFGHFFLQRMVQENPALGKYSASTWVGKYEDKGHPDKFGPVYAERINSAQIILELEKEAFVQKVAFEKRELLIEKITAIQ